MTLPIYNILIIEDNLSYTLELEMMLEKIGHQIISSTNNTEAALKIIYSKKIDIILMGVRLKENPSSIPFNQQIQQLNIPTILMTSKIDHQKHELSQTSNTIGFFIKPIHPFSLESTIDFALQSHKTILKKKYQANPKLFHDSIFAKSGNKSYQKILIQNIQCVEAAGNYSYIYTRDNKYISNLKFKELEYIFYPKGFVKVHRSFIINALHIQSINMEENIIKLENSNTIPLSRSHKQRLWNQIKKRMV